MRQLTDHTVNGDSVNHQLAVEVLDEPGHGGACHHYAIVLPEFLHGVPNLRAFTIAFQNGPIKEFGVNGVTHEALLAILIDRMRGFQSGPFVCRDNAIALMHLEEALMWLQRRTRERIKRGVEGTHER